MATFKKKQDERQKKSQVEPEVAGSQRQDLGIIGEEEVKEAAERMKKYQASKSTIDQKATNNQDWWRLRHWSMMSRNETAPEKSTSAWLFNSIINKHADIMDNYPKPNILPREADDEQDAKSLSKIIPVMLERNKYRRTYSTAAYDFINDGGCITGVFWDNTKNDGMGDVTIQQVDIHNIVWEPGIENLQDSREVFVLSSVKNDDLIAQYPQMQDKTGQDYTKVEYTQDEQRDTSDESIVVDWYYKVQRYEDVDVAEGVSIPRPITTLHYCKFCNGVLLYASENDPSMDKGFYHHGEFPLVIRRLFPIKDSPWGFGYIDIMRNPQMIIDVLDTMIANNSVQAGKARFWVREDAAVNMDEFSDWAKAFVRFSGNIDDVIKKIEVPTMPAFIVNHKTNKIDELKETSGNRDFSQGSTQSGVTAASAIAALQEAGSKLSRDMIRSYYEGFEEETYLVIELIRQFYTEPRSFRIDNKSGQYEFAEYSNANMTRERTVDAAGGMQQLMQRKAIFDVQVVAEKQSPFSRAAQNETIKELYNMGFFVPANAEQAIVALDAMEFEGKDAIKQQIQQNSLLMQQVQRMQQTIMQADEMLPQLGLAVQAGLADPAEAMQRQAAAPSGKKESGTPEERAAKTDTDSTLAAKARTKAAQQAKVG